MKTVISPVKGTRDFYPSALRKRRMLLAGLQKTIESFGYDPYDAPMLEPLSLYAAKSSPEIIERQSYVFDDRSGERLVLRPEMTPSLARMVAARQRELPSIIRWYSFADCWRYERPQKGRLRNFLQVNVDLLGSDTVEADVEVLDLSLSMLRDAGADLSRIDLRLNDRALLARWLNDVGYSLEQAPALLSLLDERSKLTPEEFRMRLTDYLSEEQAVYLEDKLQLSSESLALEPGGERLAAIMKGLSLCGWESQVRFDPTVIRGFTYYTGMVFEVYETSGVFGRAVFGGGRYDQLVEALGGQSISGVGFGVSDVSLEEVLKTQERSLVPSLIKRVMIIPRTLEEAAAQQELAILLRTQGVDAITSLPPYGFSTQLALASKLEIGFAILISPSEWQERKVVVRDLKTGNQTLVIVNDLADFFRDTNKYV
jgi:histidyl-tRNA synthetase